MRKTFSGRNASMRTSSEGVIVAAREVAEWQHPWSMRCQWDEDRAGWLSFVRPGFVNGRDVYVANAEGVYVALTDEEPAGVLLAWRDPLLSLGYSEDLVPLPGEGYPKFFDDLGVKLPAASLDPAFIDPDDPRTAEIRACDVALIAPRLATSQSLTIEDPIATGQTVSIGTTFHQDYYELHRANPYRLGGFAKWAPPPEPTVLDRLTGSAVEPQTDELLLATIWVVSPPNYTSEDQPDATWTPYVEFHDVYWNLMLASRNVPPKVPPRGIQLFVPLAGGVAQPIIDSILAPINDAFGALMALLNSADYKGKFWNT